MNIGDAAILAFGWLPIVPLVLMIIAWWGASNEDKRDRRSLTVISFVFAGLAAWLALVARLTFLAAS